MSARDRFDAYTMPLTDGCVLWIGGRSAKGYGRFGDRRRSPRVHFAHRWIWEEEHGTIPEGQQIHHTCERKDCVNLRHLAAVSATDHARVHGRRLPDGAQHLGAEVNRQKTHCKRGHPLSGANLYRIPKGGRGCRACNRLRMRRYRERQEASNLA